MKYEITETMQECTAVLATFEDETEAENYYNNLLKEDGGQPAGGGSWIISLNEMTFDKYGDRDNEENDPIESQFLYDEGSMDRCDGKDSSIYYGFESYWSAEKQELIYTFYFQGERQEEKVLESELHNWYYN